MAQQVSDVVAFGQRVGCDERSLSGLQNLSPGDQLVVMDVVEKQECKNPSAVVWSTVRLCQKNPGHMRLEYLHRNLDERCKEALLKLSPSVQESLCQQLDLAKARNLSAFVFSMIKEAHTNPAQFSAVGSQKPAAYGAPVAYAAPAAYGAPVMMPYGRDRSRSPMGLMGPIASMAPALQGPGPLGPVLSKFKMRFAIDDKATQALQSLSAEDQFIVCGLVEKQNPRNPSAVTWSMYKVVCEKPMQAKLEYLKHVVDSNAAQALEKLHPEDLEKVLYPMDLSNVRNVSAFIWSRVKEVAGLQERPAKGVSRGAIHEEAFHESQVARSKVVAISPPASKARNRNAITVQASEAHKENRENDLESVMSMGLILDQKCQEQLAELSYEDQMEILGSVDANVRNPSAYVWSKVRSMVKAK